MKNIRVYDEPKYHIEGDIFRKDAVIPSVSIASKECYTVSGDNIWKKTETLLVDEENHDLIDKLRDRTDWHQASQPWKDYYVVEYNGRNYYKCNEVDVIYKEWTQNFYVTTIVGEKESEYGEDDPNIIKGILWNLSKTFNCHIHICNHLENDNYIYLECFSTDINDVRSVLNAVVGKHVYRKTNENNYELII